MLGLLFILLIITIYSSTTNDYVRTGQTAEINCMVINPTDKLDFAWYNETGVVQGNIILLSIV